MIGKKSTFVKLNKNKLLLMKEGFWWGFVGVCCIEKIKINEVSIDHFKRESGQAGYKLKNLLGIIVRNIIGIIKIKFTN